MQTNEQGNIGLHGQDRIKRREELQAEVDEGTVYQNGGGSGKQKEITVGDRFGRLTVVEFDGARSQSIWWKCLCKCGNEVIKRASVLNSRQVSSCGCLRREIVGLKNISHGLSNTPEHKVWKSMKSRCYRKNDRAYHNYGGRGIKVCDRWRNSFEAFIEDMKPRPDRDYWLERVDNNGDYCPENCIWASCTQQARNKRNNRFLTLNGVTKCLAEWAIILGIDKSSIRDRIITGWPIELALTLPKGSRLKKNLVK